MVLKKIIDTCYKTNVELTTDGEQLELLFDERPTDELLHLIRTHKTELIRYLLGGGDIYLDKGEKDTHLPRVKVSAAQKNLWLTHQLEGNRQLNLVKALEIKGNFNLEVAQKAIAFMIHRHCALRTSYKFADGEVFQEINEQKITQIITEDLRALDAGGIDEKVSQLIDAAAAISFDLNSGDLLRVKFVKLTDNKGILVFCVHHIAVDGWSLGVVVRDFCNYYQALLGGGEVNLPAPDTAYRDQAIRDNLAMAAGHYQDSLYYWKNKLDNMAPVHGLSLDKMRPKIRRFAGKSITKILGADVLAGLCDLAHQQKVTLFNLFHAAFTILLARHSDTQDIVIGTMVANRSDAAQFDIVGNFAQPVVLRQQLPDKSSFIDYLQLVMLTSLEMLDHQHLPFELIKDIHKSEQGNAYHPLFQIMLSMDNSAKHELNLLDCELKILEVERDVSEFDLTLRVITQDHSQPALVFEYNTDIFTFETIENYGEHLLNLLCEILRDPLQDIYALNMFTNVEQTQLASMSGYKKNFPNNGDTLIALFERQLASSPSAIALSYGLHEINYQELSRQINKLASVLSRCTPAPGSVVGICLERSVDMIVAILATLKANRIYVPLDPCYPKSRLEYIITDAAVTTVIANERAIANIRFEQVAYILLENGDVELQQARESSFEAKIISDPDCFNLVYTSGSTGVPKGIMGSQKSFINRLAWMWEHIPYVDGDVACLRTSLNFIDHVCEIFSPLLQGVPAVLLDDEQIKDVVKMAHILDEYKVTHVFMVPSLIRELLHYPNWSGEALKVCLSCGETLDIELAAAFYRRFSEATLFNVYGSTEVSADVAFFDVGLYAYSTGPAPRVPVGKPIANCQIFILGAQGRYLCPIGAQGEIFVGGSCLSLGYSDQQLTSQRFVSSPLDPSQRLFQTGDLGRWNRQGLLEFIGRKDEQIKVNGCRIELAEVETVLRRCEFVNDAKVITKVDSQGRVRLVAYIVSADKAPDLIAKIKSESMQNLVNYMVPAYFEIIKQFPLLPNGKIDKKELEKRPFPINSVPATAPRNELEEALCALWKQIAQVNEIGVYDNFFDAGGNSLIIMSFTREIECSFGLRIPASKVFEGMTVAFCAQYLSQLQALALDVESGDSDEVIDL